MLPHPDLPGWVRKALLCAVLCLIAVTSDSATPWTTTHQGPLCMGLFRQEYWSGLPFPPLGNLPNSGIEPASPVSPALAGGFFNTSATWEAHIYVCM